MRRRARGEYEQKYTAAANCTQLTECYELAIALSEKKRDAETVWWKALKHPVQTPTH
jgi:hypothetical protein